MDNSGATTALSNPPRTLTEAWQQRVAAMPHHPCIRYFDGVLTVAEVDGLSAALASALAARGVTAGDRVAISLQNIPHFPIAMLAIWRVGGIVVPLNPMYRSRELHTVLASSGAVGLICAPEAVELAEMAAPGTALEWVLTADDRQFQSENDPRVFPAGGEYASPDLETFPFTVSDLADAFVDFAGECPEPTPRDSDDIAMLSYTSGTTGPPKGAQSSHRSIIVVAFAFSSWAHITSEDRFLALAPLFHITGSVVIGVGGLLSPSCLVFVNRPRPDIVLEAFTRQQVTIAIAPITLYNALLELTHATHEDFASVRQLFTGGAPVPPAKVAAFEERFGQYISNAYGLTETNAAIICVPTGERAPVHEATGTLSIGKAMAGVQTRVLDEAGAEVPAGHPGELELASVQLASGYWGDPTATKAAFPGGRFLTGDVAIIDEEGWVYLIDRIKDQINSSGYKVWPREVEDVLYEHDAVREAAVVGEPDDHRGESVLAYVSLSAGQQVTEDELIAFARQHLAAYKIPRRIVFVQDLPKTLTGKIKRRELRETTSN